MLIANEVELLLQSLLLVVTLTLLGTALLTSSLVTAKAHFHEVVIQQAHIAMSEATADLVTRAQENIRQNGIEQLPSWAATRVTSGPQAACAGMEPSAAGNTSPNDCKLFRSVTWNITGYDRPAQNAIGSDSASEATNLAKAQNESRISATINVAISDAAGSTVYALQSRQLTARVFHASPYVVVTGERDASSETGSIKSSEGDAAGYARQQQARGATVVVPTLTAPAHYTDTTLLTTIDCGNTIDNSSRDPQLDDNSVAFSQLRGVGNLSWAYEVPCDSADPINPATAPAGYAPPKDSVYGTTASGNSTWYKDNDNLSSFAR